MAGYSSIGSGVTITGLSQVQSFINSQKDQKKPERFIKEIIEETANLIRQFAPRGATGNLEGSIDVVKINNLTYAIRVKVSYAKFLEWGTRYIEIGSIKAPKACVSSSGKLSYRPFIRPAVWIMVNDYKEIIGKALFSSN